MHEIIVQQVGTKYTLVVDGLVVLYTSNANIARAYAQAAKLHYTSSSSQYTIVPDEPERVTSVRKWTLTSSDTSSRVCTPCESWRVRISQHSKGGDLTAGPLSIWFLTVFKGESSAFKWWINSGYGGVTVYNHSKSQHKLL